MERIENRFSGSSINSNQKGGFMRREDLNIFANALLDVLPDYGIPEGLLVIAAEEAGCIPGSLAIEILVVGGLLKREADGFVKPGPKWNAVLEARKRWQEQRKKEAVNG